MTKLERVLLRRHKLSDLGLCIQCGRKRNFYKSRCDACAIKHRLESRFQHGSKKWTKRGSAPIAFPQV